MDDALAAACEQHAIPALYSSDHYLAVAELTRGSLDTWGRTSRVDGSSSAWAAVPSRMSMGSSASRSHRWERASTSTGLSLHRVYATDRWVRHPAPTGHTRGRVWKPTPEWICSVNVAPSRIA